MRIATVDAFTRIPFRGNPAAVCILDGPMDALRMQNIAAEMNLSETAFLCPEGEQFGLRWFTPTTEVSLCGHATLASAHLLWEDGHLAPDQVATFQTQSGALLATRANDGIVLDFPATPAAESPAPAGLVEALGCDPLFIGRSRLDYLVQLQDETAVRALQPNLDMLSRVDARGIIVTARGQDWDFVSRFFAPAAGVPEDPVTGSAHCALTPFWAPRLGKTALKAFQASSRGGELNVSLKGDRVHLGGNAVTTLRAELCV